MSHLRCARCSATMRYGATYCWACGLAQDTLGPVPTEQQLSWGQRTMAVIWVAIIAAAVIFALSLSGCELPPEGLDPMLMEGVNQGNIGRSDQAFPANSSNVAPQGEGPVVGIVKFQGGDDNDPRVLTGTVYAYSDNQTLQQLGPVTGIALWASGDGLINQAEFDIPVQTLQDAQTAQNNFGNTPLAGGVQFSVAASSLEIRARNDAKVLPRPRAAFAAEGNLGGIPDNVNNPVRVTASIAQGNRAGSSKITRTIWALNNLVQVLAPDGIIDVFIPPYATSFIIQRGVLPGALQFTIFGSTFSDGPYTIPAGTRCPEILLSGQSMFVRIHNDPAGANINNLQVVFFLNL